MSAAIERLEPLVGEWNVVAALSPDDNPAGRCVFEWVLDGAFLIERSEIPGPVPDSVSLYSVAADGGGFTHHYYDSRGVARLYAMTLEDGVWTMSREAPDFSPLRFHQRYTGRFDAGAARIDGAWEVSHDEGVTWELDFELTHTRIT